MALGTVTLGLGLNNKEFKKGILKATNDVKKQLSVMKNLIVAAKLGSYLFAGAAQQAQEELKLVQTEMSALAEGFSQDMIDGLKPLIDQLDFFGVAADQAADSLYKFILSGRAMGLQTLGIYLDKDTQSMLTAMTAAERYAWAIENIPQHLDKINQKLTPTTKAFYEFQKRADDVKKALGTSFLGMIVNVVNSLGGVASAMKTAIIAFTAYKTAMIIGNVAIGISKAIATGSVFAAPIAIGMGVAALAAIGALIGGASLAVSALNNIPSPDSVSTSSGSTNSAPKNETVVVINDKFGQVQKSVSRSSGGNSSSIQTNYGSSNN